MPLPRVVSAIAALTFSFGALFLVTGCGGGGGGATPTPTPSSSPRTAHPQLTIQWPARSRDVSAPTSALSATISLQGAGGSLSFTADRPTGAAAVSQAYTAPNTLPVGDYQVNIACFAQAQGGGARVAAGTVQATLAADGQLPTVSLVQTIASVEVAAGQNVHVSQQTDLVVTARDGAGAVVAVTPGSFSLTVTANSQRLRYLGGTQVDALAPGVATVVATVDGVTGAPATVTVVSDTAVSVNPASTTIGPGAALPLTATVTGAPDTSVTWSVQEGDAGGTITSAGFYTAPATTGTYHIIATSVYDPAHFAIATVGVQTGGIGVGGDFPPSGGIGAIIQ